MAINHILVVTNRKQVSSEWQSEPLLGDELYWLKYELVRTGEKTELHHKAVEQELSNKMPGWFSHDVKTTSTCPSDKIRRALVFAPGARSYATAVNSGVTLQDVIKEGMTTAGSTMSGSAASGEIRAFEGCVILYSIAVEPPNVWNAISKKWYIEQRKRIEDGSDSFGAFITELTLDTAMEVNIWGQSAGTVILQEALNSLVERVILTGSAIESHSLNKGEAAEKMINNTKFEFCTFWRSSCEGSEVREQVTINITLCRVARHVGKFIFPAFSA